MDFHSIFTWALHAVEDKAKRAAIEQIQKATLQLNEQVEKHAPDMCQAVQSNLSTIAAHAIAGLATKK